MNEQRTMHNFVAAVAPDQVTIEPARADLIRRADVVQTVDRMIDGYMTQQRTLLDQVQGETTHNGFLSGADQVRERRKTSGMYLTTYGMVSGLTMGGLAYLGALAGVEGAAALAVWMFGTGALTMLLAWARHGDEFKHSPEGIARHLLDWHGSIAEYESETRRLSLQWEHAAEERRQAAQERAAADGRALAELRVKELDARRRTIEAQRAQMYAESPQTLQDGAGRTEAALQVSAIENDDATPTGGAVGDGWQGALVQWVASLYDAGAITEGGIIKGRVPWAARSPWVDADKAEAKRVCTLARPALIEQADGGRWRLRIEAFSTVDQALAVLSPRLRAVL
jgi:hypothetical protein